MAYYQDKVAEEEQLRRRGFVFLSIALRRPSK
jgi:hypothetical protein